MQKDTQQIIAEVLNFQVTTSILDHISDIVWVKDIKGHYMAVSESYNKLLDLAKDYIIGKTDKDFYSGSLSDYADDQYVILNRETTVTQKSHFLPNGEIRFFEIQKSPIYDVKNNVIGIVATGRDITESIHRQEHLHFLGYHDMLTALYNRNYFEQLPVKLLKERVRELGIIICDIDGLKLVNDTLGHTEGDERIKSAAGILKQAAGNYGDLARIGGDEFVIVLPNASQELIDKIIRRMKSTIEEKNHGCEILPLNISFGVAIGDLAKTDFFTLFKEADNSMYRDKMLHAESTHNSVVKTMMKMLSIRDYIMEGHVERLKGYVAKIGQQMGLSASKINDLRLLAEFHDIGKIGIPEEILNKPGPLTTEEAARMRRHPEIGFRLAKAIPELVPIADWILRHHERWDGTGYPLGLKGTEIPIEARIVHVADAFDAMTHNRPYREALNRNIAISELEKCSGTQFDPMVVETFVELIDKIEPKTFCINNYKNLVEAWGS